MIMKPFLYSEKGQAKSQENLFKNNKVGKMFKELQFYYAANIAPYHNI